MEENKKPKKKKTWLWIVIGLIVIFGLIGACNGGSGDKPAGSAEPEATKAAATEAPVETEAVEATTSAKMPIAQCIQLLETNFENSFGENYDLDLDTDNHILSFMIWGENITAGAIQAQNGNADMVESWNDMTDSIVTLAKNVQQSIDENCDEAYSTVIYLINDQNHDNVLFAASGPTTLYDAVNGINLLGTE